MGLGTGVFVPLNISFVPASHSHSMCKIWSHIYRQKLLLAYGGGGGGGGWGVIFLNKCFLYFYKF